MTALKKAQEECFRGDNQGVSGRWQRFVEREASQRDDNHIAPWDRIAYVSLITLVGGLQLRNCGTSQAVYDAIESALKLRFYEADPELIDLSKFPHDSLFQFEEGYELLPFKAPFHIWQKVETPRN